MPTAASAGGAAPAARIVLRPFANPFALGFLGLAGATIVLSGQEIGWIPDHEWLQVAIIILVSAPVLQLISCVFGFLGRDPVAATGMGLLAVSWAAIGVVHALSVPHGRSPALGTFLLLAAAGLSLSAAMAGRTKVLPAMVMGLSALRFFTTALYEVLGGSDLKLAAAAVGCLLTVVAVYGAVAMELEGLEHRAVLPTLRRGRGAAALEPDLAEQIRFVAAEPGVRNQL